VVVVVGETVTDPFGCTVPTPLSIVTDVAFVDVQVNVALWPLVIEVGLADSEMLGVPAVDETVMFTEAFVTTPELSQNWTTTKCEPFDMVRLVSRVCTFCLKARLLSTYTAMAATPLLLLGAA
jgi:hypothetical protein